MFESTYNQEYMLASIPLQQCLCWCVQLSVSLKTLKKAKYNFVKST